MSGCCTVQILDDGSTAATSAGTSARVYRNVNQTLANLVNTAIIFNAARYDSGPYYNPAFPTRLTAPTAGIYRLTGNIAWGNNTTGIRDLALRRNGVDFIADNLLYSTGAAMLSQNVTTEIDLALGDYVEMTAMQGSGGSLDVESDALWSPEFMMSWVGPNTSAATTTPPAIVSTPLLSVQKTIAGADIGQVRIFMPFPAGTVLPTYVSPVSVFKVNPGDPDISALGNDSLDGTGFYVTLSSPATSGLMLQALYLPPS